MTPQVKQRIEQIKCGEVPEGYKRTKAGIMPIDWCDKKEYKAKDIFKSVTNKKHNGEFEVLSATQDKGVVPRSSVDIDIKFNEDNVSGYKKVDNGDFVISLRSFQGGIEYSEYEGLVSPAYTVLKPIVPICDGYYKAYFKTVDYISRLNKGTYGIRDGKQIGFEDFGDMLLHYPSLAEQEKIAEILSTQDNVIQLYKRKIEELEKLKKVFMQKMFPQKGENVPKWRFPQFTTPWEERKFGTMFKRRTERNNGQFDNTRWISVAKMYFQESEKVSSNNIDTRTYVMRRGDIAFEGHANAEYKYGRFVANDIGDGVISELFPIYMHIDDYDESYWKYAIQIENIMAPKLLRCIEISYTSSNKLDEDFFLKESILVPSISEQQQIGLYFRRMDDIIKFHQKKLEQEQQKKKALMQLLLTGIVRV